MIPTLRNYVRDWRRKEYDASATRNLIHEKIVEKRTEWRADVVMVSAAAGAGVKVEKAVAKAAKETTVVAAAPAAAKVAAAAAGAKKD